MLSSMLVHTIVSLMCSRMQAMEMLFALEQRYSQVFSVEGIARPRKHRHVTIAPNGPQETSDEGNVTKIELELEEAPEDAILIGSMPAQLDVAAEINSTYPNGISGTGAVVVRAEEALIVVLVLVLWVAAIALFFNRWGKIRMLEPYQPKFQQQHRQSCAAMVDQNPLQHRTYSKFNIHCMEHPVHQPGFTSGGYARPRQNSVFVGSSASLLPIGQDTPRRAKSAFDLQSLVLAECTVQSVDDEDEPVTTLKPPAPPVPPLPPLATEFSRSPLRDRRTSVCQFDRPDTLVRPLQRERGMSICQFDRMDVLARPLQRDRGLSICHFDRTDVLARPLQRDRGSGMLHFDRTDVLARPMHFSKSLSKERRVSVCNFLDRDDMAARPGQRDKRLSMSNVEKIETLGRSASKDHREAGTDKAGTDKADGFGKAPQKEKVTTVYHFERSSRSKSPDVVLGYKATCV